MQKKFSSCLVVLSVSILSGCGSGLSNSSSGSTGGGGGSSTPTFKKMFVTNAQYTGDLKTNGSGATGIAGADNLCMQDANYPGSGTYKAMLADGTIRKACTTANCSGGISEHTDWVLKASTEYRRAADTTIIIGTTTANGIFTFPLNNTVVDGSTPEADDIWTGLDNDWTTHATNCLGYTAGTGANSSMAGVSYVDSANTIQNGGGASCGMSLNIYCVEQ